jgi:hypothetical protein
MVLALVVNPFERRRGNASRARFSNPLNASGAASIESRTSRDNVPSPPGSKVLSSGTITQRRKNACEASSLVGN